MERVNSERDKKFGIGYFRTKLRGMTPVQLDSLWWECEKSGKFATTFYDNTKHVKFKKKVKTLAIKF